MALMGVEGGWGCKAVPTGADGFVQKQADKTQTAYSMALYEKTEAAWIGLIGVKGVTVMKKKLHRSLISILIAALMMVSLSVPSFAESVPGEPGAPDAGAAIDEGSDIDDGAGLGVLPEDQENTEGQPEGDGIYEGEQGNQGAQGNNGDEGVETDGADQGNLAAGADGLPAGDEGDAAEIGADETSGQQTAGDVQIPGKRHRLKGMPRGYRLSSRQVEEKAEMEEAGDAEAVEEAVEGEDYAPGEIVFLADTLQEAETIAEAYGTEVKSFEYGVAVATISEDNPASVEDLVKVAAEKGNNMPPVGVNAYIHSFGDVEPLAAGGPQDDVSAQWHLGAQWINVKSAWGFSTGEGVVVGVLDTGLYKDHLDINPNFISSIDVSVKPSIDSTADPNGHGTHVAGIIAAV